MTDLGRRLLAAVAAMTFSKRDYNRASKKEQAIKERIEEAERQRAAARRRQETAHETYQVAQKQYKNALEALRQGLLKGSPC